MYLIYFSLIDNGYNIAPAVASSILSFEPAVNELQEISYINLQPPNALTCTKYADKNLNIDTVKDTLIQTSKIQTSSISDLQVIYLLLLINSL